MKKIDVVFQVIESEKLLTRGRVMFQGKNESTTYGRAYGNIGCKFMDAAMREKTLQSALMIFTYTGDHYNELLPEPDFKVMYNMAYYEIYCYYL